MIAFWKRGLFDPEWSAVNIFSAIASSSYRIDRASNPQAIAILFAA
jgi:hypothetical protein